MVDNGIVNSKVNIIRNINLFIKFFLNIEEGGVKFSYNKMQLTQNLAKI